MKDFLFEKELSVLNLRSSEILMIGCCVMVKDSELNLFKGHENSNKNAVTLHTIKCKTS